MIDSQSEHNSFKLFSILITVFISGIYLKLGFGVLYFSYFIFLFSFLSLTYERALIYPRKLLLLFFCFSLYSILLVLFFDYEKLLQVLFSLSILFVIFTTYLHLIFKYGVKCVFLAYVKLALFFSVVAIIQECFLLLGVDQNLVSFNSIVKDMGGYWGVPGFSAEPAEFAIAIIPAFYFLLTSVAESRKHFFYFLIVLVALILSTSSLGFLGILLSLLCLFFEYVKRSFFKMLVTLPLFVFFVGYLLGQDFFMMRVVDSIYLLDNIEFIQPDGINLSSYAQVVNLKITLMSLKEYLGFGPGFTLYSSVFDSYISNFSIPSHRDDIPGRGTATSLVLRLTAEFGLLGLIFFVFFIIKYRVAIGKDKINTACFIFILLSSLRMGIYFANGMCLFILLYYFSSKSYINR
ncbi:MAG: O-antigen ligase family protein [Pseudoalteromonas sp.]|uniref:O-antigen ligase family protein n=1 Tax=Pseudoalteromonas sp. TaxID=53249 RepID=UPI001D67BDF6|nr:O-antigen ligase family protein [Pseudoalteromonas sp.]NRA79510.1 O-antigen ligase family protein [Pseudoalteromonas sp.]